MIRNLKVLGLVLGMTAVFGAFSASPAMATTEPVASFVAAEYPVTYTGTQDGSNHTITFPGGLGVTTCSSTHFDEVGVYEASTTTLVFTPTYSGCNTEMGADLTNPTTITHNGCILEFTVHEEVIGSNGDTWKGDVQLWCPNENGIEIHIWDTEGKHKNNEATKCTFRIEPQTIKGIVYHNDTKNGDVTIEAKEIPFTVKRLSGAVGDCGVATQTAKYNGNITVDALNKEGKAIVTKIVAGMP